MIALKWLPTLQLVSGAALISFSPVFVKLAHVSPTTSAFYRTAFGGLVLVGLGALDRRRGRIGRRAAMLAVVCGLLLAVDLAVWHRSIQFVGPGLATILGNFQVFVLAGFGIVVLREHVSLRLGVAVPLAVIGLLLIFGLRWEELGANYRLGVLFGLLTALFYGAFILMLRKAQGHPTAAKPVVTMAVLSLAAAAFLAVSVVLEGEGFAIPDRTTWAALLGYALVAQVIGWVLISKGLPNVQASRAGLILLLQPSLAFVWDVVLFARPTTMIEVVGATLALSAIYLGITGKKR